MELNGIASASSQRLVFDSAYDKLAQTVRNFSREKLVLEETISGYVQQISALASSLSEKNQENEAVVEENKRLQYQHEDDCSTHSAVDAMVTNLTEKQTVLSEMLGQFQMIQEEIDSKCQESMNVVDSLKIRHVQVFNYMSEMKNTFQREAVDARAEYEASLNNYNKLVEELEGNVTKLRMQGEEKDSQIQELSRNISTIQAENMAQVQNLMASLAMSDATVATLQNKLVSSGEALGEKVEKIDELILQFKESSAENEAQLQGYRKLLEESELSVVQLKKHCEEKDSQIQGLSETMTATQTENLAQIQKLMDSLAVSDATVATLQNKLASSGEALEEKVMKIDELILQFKESSAESEAQLQEYRKLLEESELSVAQFKKQSEEKDSQIQSLSETMTAAQTENLAQLQNLKESLAEAETNVAALQNKLLFTGEALEEKVKKIDDLIAEFKQASIQSEAQLEECQTLLKESEASVAELKKQSEEKDLQIQGLSETMTATQTENLAQIQKLMDSLALADTKVSSLQDQLISTGEALEEKNKEIDDLSAQFHEASAENEIQLDGYHKQLEEIKNNVAQKEVKIKDLIEKHSAIEADYQAQLKNYKLSLGAAETHVATLQDKLLSNAPTVKPISRTSSTRSILKTNPNSATGLIRSKRVSWGDANEGSKTKMGLAKQFSSSSSSSDEENQEEVDPTFEMPLKRSRLSDKQDSSHNRSSSAFTSSDSIFTPRTPLRRTTPMPDRCYPRKTPTSVSPYKFFKNRPEIGVKPTELAK